MRYLFGVYDFGLGVMSWIFYCTKLTFVQPVPFQVPKASLLIAAQAVALPL